MIKKIILEIDGKEIEVTPEQARELYDSLATMFGTQSVQYVPYYVPNYQPIQPLYPTTWYQTGVATSGYITTDTNIGNQIL